MYLCSLLQASLTSTRFTYPWLQKLQVLKVPDSPTQAMSSYFSAAKLQDSYMVFPIAKQYMVSVTVLYLFWLTVYQSPSKFLYLQRFVDADINLTDVYLLVLFSVHCSAGNHADIHQLLSPARLGLKLPVVISICLALGCLRGHMPISCSLLTILLLCTSILFVGLLCSCLWWKLSQLWLSFLRPSQICRPHRHIYRLIDGFILRCCSSRGLRSGLTERVYIQKSMNQLSAEREKLVWLLESELLQLCCKRPNWGTRIKNMPSIGN